MALDENFLPAIALAFGLGFLILILWMILFEIRLKKLFRGRRAQDLQNILIDIQKEVRDISDRGKEIDFILKNMESRLQMSVRHVGVVRFNPYADSGGDQSFALAMMDENKDGFVILSLYGRESNRMYAKPVAGGKSQHNLSREEEEAIEKALLRLRQ